MTSKTIHLPIDELEYTRDGLKTRSSLPLDPGAHHRVVLVRPDRARPIVGGTIGFAADSAFPLPATLMAFWRARPPGSAFTHHAERDERWHHEVFQIYGHGGPTGSESHNKVLSERRARVGHALMTRDVEAFRALADEDGWGSAEFQSMLRCLACDPGPVDGHVERLTKAGVSKFAERYNRGVYHHETGDSPGTELPTTGALDEAAKRAILEAFVLAHGVGHDQSTAHPTHPVHGCSLYNARTNESGAPNRRIAVVAYAEVPPLSENAPCVAGDERACAVVDDEPQRCLWYREHVQEPAPETAQLFDPRWLWLGNDLYLLSALTTEDDGADVTFEVFDGDESASEAMTGIVRGGTANVVWKSPFPVADERGKPELGAPRFEVRHRHAQASSGAPWPELLNVRVLKIVEDVAVTQKRQGGLRLIARDGSYDYLCPFAELVEDSAHHVALEFPDVPSDARVDLVLETGDFACTLLASAAINQLAGHCGASEQCLDLPARPGPPTHRLDDVDLGDFATVGQDEGAPSNFEIPPPPGNAPWLDAVPDAPQ